MHPTLTAHRPSRPFQVAGEDVEVFTDGSCVRNGCVDAAAGSGIWFGPGDARNASERVPGEHLSNQTAEIYAVMMAHRAVAPFAALHVVSDSRYVVDGLTKWLPKWERRGWIDVANAALLQHLVALLCTRSAATTFRWVKGHSGDPGNEGADRLAAEGAAKPVPYLPLHPPPPRRFLKQGVELVSLTQRLAYRAILLTRPAAARAAALANVERALSSVHDWCGPLYAPATLWNALRKDPIEPKVRDFLWKTLHRAYRVGPYWSVIPGYEDRALCRHCGVPEDMEHILTACAAPGQADLWDRARALLRRADVPLPEQPSLGLYLGAPLFTVAGGDDTVRRASSRLARLVLSETAHTIWALRCERVIQWHDSPDRVHAPNAVRNQWYAVLDRRLWLDQQRVRRTVPGGRPLPVDVVRATWEPVLDMRIDRESDWVREQGVLVGRQA
ncbi:ribonuclease H-like protein [Cubamyces menziesii]|nr:ribonuclease H-like protein [Cubamyces menziesii]